MMRSFLQAFSKPAVFLVGSDWSASPMLAKSVAEVASTSGTTVTNDI